MQNKQTCQKQMRERVSYEKNWDYTKHAKFYSYRPNYADRAIDTLCFMASNGQSGIKVADIGAGTGNLSIMLNDRGFKVSAVEPNEAMREIGKARTQESDIVWISAGGYETGLEDKAYDWVTFGSSFNVLDRNRALQETHRILKTGGYFTCMWNHRDLDDVIQCKAQECIKKFIEEYQTGTRREDQRPIIEANKDLFDEICYVEQDFYFHQSIENYILAWQSVKNPYWDLNTDDGKELFSKITEEMRKQLPDKFDIKYTTRAWSAKKV